MNPTHLENILKDALLYGNHADTCALAEKQKGLYLPAGHPDRPAKLEKNPDQCTCWKKKALRMQRALSRVERTESEPD